VALRAGSCAAGACEPRQVRKEAAVSSYPWATQDYLVGVGWPGKSGDNFRRGVHDRLARSGAGQARPFSLPEWKVAFEGGRQVRNSVLSVHSTFGRASLTAWHLLGQLGQASFITAFLGLALVGVLLAGYHLTSVELQLVVDGQPRRIRTHQTTVQAVLQEEGMTIRPQDIISPPPDAPVSAGDTITVRLARSVTVEADGQVHRLLTHRRKIADLLSQAGIVPGPHDRVLVDGRLWDLNAELPQLSATAMSPQAASGPESGRTAGLAHELRPGAPVYVVLKRAIPIFLDDGGVPITIYTTRATVGEALLERGITLFLGDRVTPSLGSRASAGMRVFVERANPVDILVDGQLVKTRSRRETVADVLADEAIVLTGRDYTRPALSARVSQDMAIQVVRVWEAVETEQEQIPFETTWEPDPALELDQQKLVQEGESGLNRRRFRVTYENGAEVARELEDAWLDKEPSAKIVAYGTHIVVRELDTPEGKLEYWRKFRALVTSYTAATCGKTRDDPYYGITSMGLQAGRGIVAVDPRVINMGSTIYVPGYGEGFVGDTGGQIIGRRVDLGYDEDDWSEIWYKWSDVYLLTPVPPEDKIRWVLPNWPQERRR
jgi:uncharacterized protein YabE (DUF348 family)